MISIFSVMDSNFIQVIRSPGFASLACVLAYFLLDALLTRSLIRKQRAIPLVGSPSAFVPRFVPNLLFAWKAANILAGGYCKVCVCGKSKIATER
jgi:hypothetical protein